MGFYGTVRSGAEERTFQASLNVLIFSCVLVTFLYRTVQNIVGQSFTKHWCSQVKLGCSCHFRLDVLRQCVLRRPDLTVVWYYIAQCILLRGGGGGICNKTVHQIRVCVNACAVHAYISCECVRSACLKFVPQTWWRVRAAAPRIEARPALQLISAAAFFVDAYVMSVTCLFSFFLFFFFGSSLVDLGNL